MKDSQMAVRSRMVGKWYFRERMRKPEVPVNVQKETEKEKGKATDIGGGAINDQRPSSSEAFFFFILAKETNRNHESK